MATVEAPRSADARTLANYVGGAWSPAGAADSIPDVDPATGEIAAMVPLSNAADVDAAVAVAREAKRRVGGRLAAGAGAGGDGASRSALGAP